MHRRILKFDFESVAAAPSRPENGSARTPLSRKKELPYEEQRRRQSAGASWRGVLFRAQLQLLPMTSTSSRAAPSCPVVIRRVGLSTLGELLERMRLELAGPRGQHYTHRSNYSRGSAPTVLPFGGRRTVVTCSPRTSCGRRRAPAEKRCALPRHRSGAYAVLDQILLTVSTRGYHKCLKPVPAGVIARGTSKSATSRHLMAP